MKLDVIVCHIGRPGPCPAFALKIPEGMEELVLEVGVARTILHHARDLIRIPIDFQDSSQNVCRFEILLGDLTSDDHSSRAVEGRRRIPHDKRNRENVKQIRIRPHLLDLIEDSILMLDQRFSPVVDTGSRRHGWELLLEHVPHRRVRHGFQALRRPCLEFHGHAEDGVRIWMIIVVASLEANKHHDIQYAYHPDGKSQDVDKRISFVLPNMPRCGHQIMSQHGDTPVEGMVNEPRKRSEHLSPPVHAGFDGSVLPANFSGLLLKIPHGTVADIFIDHPRQEESGQLGRFFLSVGHRILRTPVLVYLSRYGH